MSLQNVLLLSLCLLLIIPVSSLVVRKAFATAYTDITVLEAKSIIDSNPFLVVLDVRNESEYVTGHIRNAKLIPLYELGSRLNELNISDDILVYCRTGGRSTQASQILASNGFLHIYNMLGGIVGWTLEQYPVYVKYPSIQEAINNATDGDTIYVSSGYYTEHLSVNKSIALIGENRDTTTIDGTANGTIFYVKSDNVSISDFAIQYSGCSCSGYSGVDTESYHQNINITHNTILRDGYGIHLNKASKVIITQNNITQTTDSCVVVSESSQISVTGNDITDNVDGINIQNSNASILSDNTIYNNAIDGISLSYSNNNTISGNNISSNKIYGLYITQSSNNSIFQNSFLENADQVSSDRSANVWDNGLEGNFWSNYTGVDTDLDGIGETPQVIDANNIDNYPLMGMFNSFHTSLNYDVNIVSNSTVDDFEYFASNSTVSFRVSSTTPNQTAGFCRVSIPYALINPNNSSISVIIDNGQTPVLFLNNSLHDDGSHRWIYFTYPHSTHEIILVPEFPLFFILPLFIIATLTVGITYKRRRIGVHERALFS
jgi:parallel beta-helix repeat protein